MSRQPSPASDIGPPDGYYHTRPDGVSNRAV